MAITKKTYLDNSILKELTDNYPPLDADNGVAYRQKLDYLTFEIDFLSDSRLRAVRRNYGNDVIIIIFYIRTIMCNNGWKVRIDGDFYQDLINDCGYTCNVKADYVNTVIHALVEKGIFYIVQDEQVEEGQWLTCTQQVYNYEMACNNRQQNRKRQEKHRAAKNKSQSQEQAQQPMSSSPLDCPNGQDPFGIPFEQNPFGIPYR